MNFLELLLCCAVMLSLKKRQPKKKTPTTSSYCQLWPLFFFFCFIHLVIGRFLCCCFITWRTLCSFSVAVLVFTFPSCFMSQVAPLSLVFLMSVCLSVCSPLNVCEYALGHFKLPHNEHKSTRTHTHTWTQLNRKCWPPCVLHQNIPHFKFFI